MPTVRGELIRRLRQERGLTLRELAGRLNLSHTYLSRIERGEQDPSLDTLASIADALGVSLRDLILDREVQEPKAAISIPVLGIVDGGGTHSSSAEVEEYLVVPASAVSDSGSDSFFALRVKGDAMAPTIPDGSIVIVRRQPSVQSGQIAVVQCPDRFGTCIRRVYVQDSRLVLQSDNRHYPPVITSRSKVRILGRVTKVLVDLQDAAAVEPATP